jgi:uncharacterized protein YfiM (DUF2279 family)
MHLTKVPQKNIHKPAPEESTTSVASRSCMLWPLGKFRGILTTLNQTARPGLSFIIGACMLSFTARSQDSTALSRDTAGLQPVVAGHIPRRPLLLAEDSTTLSATKKKQRIKIVGTANLVGYSAAMIGLYHAWYKDYPQGNFHVFNDIREWKQMDKLGHVYSAYAESKASMELWRWTGISRKKRIWLGGMSGAMYQTAIEVLDGFSTEWGWSWGDFAANVTGSGMLVAQELAWDEQRIQMKWSFHRKRYADPVLNDRSNDLFGQSSPERFLKDYNGQTYWISTTLKPFFPDSRIPAWLQLSVGTGAEGLLGGYENIGKDKDGNISFSRPDIKRYRQWYLAPDVDLTKIKTNKKGIKLALQLLNVFKFPTPSLEMSNGKLSWNWIHF